jgi:hypothetical protein
MILTHLSATASDRPYLHQGDSAPPAALGLSPPAGTAGYGAVHASLMAELKDQFKKAKVV